MRIGINGSFWDKPTTGSGQYLHELLPALARLAPEHDYAVILPRHKEARPVAASSPRISFHSESVMLDRLCKNQAKVWFEQVVFGRACEREQVSLAHIPYFASPLVCPTRTVVTIHDLIPLILPLYRGSLMVRAYMHLVSASARRADVVIADSESSKRDIVERLHIPESRVHTVHLAAAARYHPFEQVDSVRAKYGLPTKFLLYLGGYDQRKNVRVIIQAFAQLPECYREGYRLVLGGVVLGKDSEFFPAPDRMVREAGLSDDAVQYLGWVAEEDKPALYSSASVFLFPSLYEGFGLPPLEAMACGTPVIAAKAASLPEVVGNAAICLDPHDSLAWAEAMRSVLTDGTRHSELRARGLAQAAKFSWERAARETLAAYRAALV